jgi:hypothetical protein
MTEPRVIWQDRIEETFDKLRWADKDAQEQACQAIQEEFKSEEAGARLRELFEAEADRMKAASFILPEAQPSVEKPKVATPIGAEPKLRRLAAPVVKPAAPEAKPAVAKPSPFFDGRKGPVIGWPKEWPEAPLAPPSATEFEKLLYPPGLLGHSIQYVMDTAGLPSRELALGVSLSALGKGLDRKVIGPSFNTVLLFILLIAETGAGKQHGLDCIRMLLRAMGLEHCYAASGLASVQAIEEIIEGIPGAKGIDPNPDALVVIDEVGSWLQRILSGGRNPVGNVGEIPAHLQILWGQSAKATWMGTKKVGKEMRKWHSVAFALIGFSTEKAFFKALKEKLISSGFVNRMLLFNVGRGAEERVDPKYGLGQCPEWLVKALKRVTNLDAVPFDEPMRLTVRAKDGSEMVWRDFHRLDWGPGVKEACRAYEKQIRGMPSVNDRELWIRTHDIALRLATIVAVYRCSGTVEMQDWNWAVAIAKRSTQQLKQGVDKHMLEELEDKELADLIRDYFRDRKNKVVSIGTISKHLESHGGVRKIQEVIWHVVRTGDIEQVEMPPGPGRPTVYFRWNKGSR